MVIGTRSYQATVAEPSASTASDGLKTGVPVDSDVTAPQAPDAERHLVWITVWPGPTT